MGHFGADTQTHHFWYMNYLAFKSNHMNTIYIYWIWELGTLGQTRNDTSSGRWTIGLPKATTWPQFIYIGFENGAFWGRRTNTSFGRWTIGLPKASAWPPFIYTEFENGALWDRHTNTLVLVSKSYHSTTIYIHLTWEWGSLGADLQAHQFS